MKWLFDPKSMMVRDKESGDCICKVAGDPRNNFNQRDGRKISLAPEMAEALRECVQSFKIISTIHGGLSPAASNTLDNARAILAKLEE